MYLLFLNVSIIYYALSHLPPCSLSHNSQYSQKATHPCCIPTRNVINNAGWSTSKAIARYGARCPGHHMEHRNDERGSARGFSPGNHGLHQRDEKHLLDSSLSGSLRGSRAQL